MKVGESVIPGVKFSDGIRGCPIMYHATAALPWSPPKSAIAAPRKLPSSRERLTFRQVRQS